MMFRKPDVVETMPIGVHDLVDGLPDDARLGLRIVWRHRHLVEQSELHVCTPLRVSDH